MSFSFAWCRHFFAFLRRFYLCGADTSLSYVVFTCVVQTLVHFLTSFSFVWRRLKNERHRDVKCVFVLFCFLFCFVFCFVLFFVLFGCRTISFLENVYLSLCESLMTASDTDILSYLF